MIINFRHGPLTIPDVDLSSGNLSAFIPDRFGMDNRVTLDEITARIKSEIESFAHVHVAWERERNAAHRGCDLYFSWTPLPPVEAPIPVEEQAVS